MASPDNPLTARVMVNRIWKHHFGAGIVRSTDNFGKMGEPPSHPELLDYLAAEFVKSGWSVKAMHRHDSAQQRVPDVEPREASQAAKVDPTNKLLQHMPVRRLEAEAIRDGILAVSGTLTRRCSARAFRRTSARIRMAAESRSRVLSMAPAVGASTSRSAATS